MTGIRQLALGMGAALLLAGCEEGLKSGDPAAAALATEEITATSLGAGPEAGSGDVGESAAADPDAKATETAVPADGKAADTPADPDTAAGSPPEAVTDAAADPAAKSAKRKGLFGFLQPKPKDGSGGAEPDADPDAAAAGEAAAADEPPAAQPAKRSSVRLVDRDVEAPDVFQVTEDGLWDGRPSLGGVWVAYSDVRDPERVIIRNTETGGFVIGALFRRERENPGPRLQVSSDAANALGMLAGAPAKLNVTALRREEVADEADAEALLSDSDAGGAVVAAPAAEKAAVPAQDAKAKPAAKPAADPAPAVETPKPAAGAPSKPFVQIGIFSVEGNANGTAGALRKAGISATVKKEASQGKTFWRVIAGPAATTAERDALVAKVKGLGFPDAYFVSK